MWLAGIELAKKKKMNVFHCFSILEDTVEIQERVENILKSLLEQLKGKRSYCVSPFVSDCLIIAHFF